MNQFPQRIQEMLAMRQLEEIGPNPNHALTVIATAQTHIKTAQLLATTGDTGMAFTATYDAARKALVAVLTIEGLRIRAVRGAHRNTGIAAQCFLDSPALVDFEWMRQVRNSTEYPSESRPTADAQDVAEAFEVAQQIVRECASYVEGRVG